VYNIYSKGQREGVTCERRVERWEQANAPKRVVWGMTWIRASLCSVARAECKSSAGGLQRSCSSQWYVDIFLIAQSPTFLFPKHIIESSQASSTHIRLA